MLALIRSNIIIALRDKLFLGMIAVFFSGLFLSLFLGNTALVEKSEMMVVYSATSIRFTVVFGMMLFICFHMQKLFDTKEIELLLSRPISRTNFFISYFFSFITILIISLIFIFLIFSIIYYNIMVEANIINVLYWFVSLLFETIIIIAYALLSGLILKSAVNAVFSSLIFYIASRIVGFFVYALQENLNRDFLENIVNYTSIVIPRLDFFAKTEWLLNGNFDHLWLIQALIYIPFLLILGIIDFNKKQF